MRALVRIATPVGCAALTACSFPVDGYTVVDPNALQGGHDSANADTTSAQDASTDTGNAADTTTGVDTTLAPDTTVTPDSTSPTDSGAGVDTGDACHCVDWAGASGHCKTWDPPGCGTT